MVHCPLEKKNVVCPQGVGDGGVGEGGVTMFCPNGAVVVTDWQMEGARGIGDDPDTEGTEPAGTQQVHEPSVTELLDVKDPWTLDL